MRSGTLILLVLFSTLGCASRTAAAPEPASSNGPIAERDAAYVSDACSHYLADAPPPTEGEFMPVSEADMAAAMSMVGQYVQPRCAHYHFVHNGMVTMLFDDPRFSEALWNLQDSPELLDMLAGEMNELCAQDNPDEWQMPRPGFHLGRAELLGRPVLVVDVIAPPSATTEAHMFAVVGLPWPDGQEHLSWTGFDRYFVLEHSDSLEPTHTVMGGWTRDEQHTAHLNFGFGPRPTPTAFLHVIGQNLCADLTQARTQMPN